MIGLSAMSFKESRSTIYGHLLLGIKVIIAMDFVTRVQNLDEVVCVLLHANILGKGINPVVLPPAIGK